jgi:hypothetical protein
MLINGIFSRVFTTCLPILTSAFFSITEKGALARAQELNTAMMQKKVLDSTVIPHPFHRVGALVSYYFWEEDSAGYLVEHSLNKPFFQNYFIACSPSKKSKDSIDYPTLKGIIQAFAKESGAKNEKVVFKSRFKIPEALDRRKYFFPLVREEAGHRGSELFVRTNGQWTSKRAGSVLYFTVRSDARWAYSHSSDSVVLSEYQVRQPANGPYMILTYWQKDEKVEKQLVYTYWGEEVTQYFLQNPSMTPERVMVFANGYRGPAREKDESDNLVVQKDRFSYWYKIDNQFIDCLQPAVAYYIDGSLGIRTSSHRSKARFAWSLFRASYLKGKKRRSKRYQALNTAPNVEGFQFRKEKGKIAGKAFLQALCSSPVCLEKIDTVDIVCHSMGYAYSLGFIEEIKEKVVFGKLYILAPESACVDSVDWNLFEEVWQYGSNLDQEDPDPLWEQDGIAPQCQVKGLEFLPPNKGGRAFIPKDWPTKNFIDSHQLYNFDWIFERIQHGESGYIGR